MATSQSTRDLISKYKVLTGFNRFIYFALAAIAINIADSLYGPYKDYDAVYILSGAALLLLLSLWLYSKKYQLTAKIISAITFNVVFLLISIHAGIKAGTYLYYFPFILAYLYLFRAEDSYKYAVGFSIVSLIFLVLSLIVAPDNPPYFKVPDAKMKQIFYLTLIISLSLTVYFFVLIFSYQEKLYNRILDLEKSNKMQQLRSIIETQETSIKNIVEELRDNINQTLAASRFFLEEAGISGDNRDLVSKSYALTDEAMNALTILCIKIHPAVIVDLGLIEGIQEYILELKKISRTEINLDYNDPGIEKIDDHDKISIFRIIQDYLILVLKNPATSRVSIGISYKHPSLVLTLRQNDLRFNFMKDSRTNNLASINNRITYFNGTIRQETEDLFETSVVELSLN